MFCNNCGKKIPINANWCQICGCPVSQPPPHLLPYQITELPPRLYYNPNHHYPYPPQYPYGQETISGDKLGYIGILFGIIGMFLYGMILGIVAIFFGGMAMSKGSKVILGILNIIVSIIFWSLLGPLPPSI